ncbi:uncharacterized protein LOC131238811 [Magnolia sinica]|uniref:uncharacterized protein LOC131238811 n=1 Tax=Magnolia sinica TaxID=86752 RepID=UPI00265AA15A|nr:uncharacterized protein LOC131238811 [Magnolia sinica]
MAFSEAVNGKIGGFFKPTRGLRQGDPLSSVLFIMAGEPFSCSLKHLVEIEACRPYKLQRGCRLVMHLLYADDTLVFMNSCRKTLMKFKVFLDSFQKASGQKIKCNKSCFIRPKSMASSRARSIERLLGFANASDEVKYLGIPLCRGRVKISDFQFLIDKFFWGWVDGAQKLHWVAWEKITRPISEGGLGIRRLNEVLSALCMKIAWEVKYGKKAGPRVSLMQAKFHTDIYRDTVNRVRDKASPYWKKIRSYFPLLAMKVQWQVGTGDLHLWTETWTGLAHCKISRLTPIPSHILSLKIRDFLGTAGLLPPLVILTYLPQHAINHIFNGGYATSEDRPSCFWPLDHSGLFTVKLAWKISRSPSSSPRWSKWLWNKTLPPKFSVFCWRLLHGAILVDD